MVENQKHLSQEFFRRLSVYMGKPENAHPAFLPMFEQWKEDHAGRRSAWLADDMVWRLGRCGDLTGKRVLDFGCGTGSSTQILAEAGAWVVAAEPDTSSIDVAVQRIRDLGHQKNVCCVKIPQILPEGNSLCFASHQFDYVTLIGVLEHMPKAVRQALAREVHRVLKPGGTVFVYDTPNRLYPVDHHTTQLWLLGWMPFGLARWYAVLRGRFDPNADFQHYGGNGISRFELDRLFDKKKYATVYDRDEPDVIESFTWQGNYIPWADKRLIPIIRAGAGIIGKILVTSAKAVKMTPAVWTHAHCVGYRKRV